MERRSGRGGLGPGVLGPRASVAAAAVGDSDWLGKWKLHIRLLKAALQPDAGGIPPDDEKMQILLSHCFLQYSEYLMRARAASSSARTTGERRRPSLGTSLEAAFMWLDGWRPSCAVVMVSSLLKAEIGVVSAAVLTNHESTHFLSEEQLRLLQPLQGSIRQAELDLSHQLALLQMLVADQSMLSALTIRSKRSSSEGGVKEIMETKMDTYQELLEQADKLRLQTLEELCKLLTPVQGARASMAAFEIVSMMRSMGGNSTLMRSMSASGLALDKAIVVDSLTTVQNLVTVPIPAGGLATGTFNQAVPPSFPILPAPVFTDATGVPSSASTLLAVHHSVEEHRVDPPLQHPAV